MRCGRHRPGRCPEVTVVGKMVDGAQRQPIDDRGYPLAGTVRHDVGGLDQLPFPSAQIVQWCGTRAKRRVGIGAGAVGP